MERLPYVIVTEYLAIGSNGLRFASVKRLEDLKDVLLKPVRSKEELYYVFRDLGPTTSYDLRFDVTVLKSCVLPDGELCRTHGHYHPEGPWGEPWPEVYGVLKGKALFVLHDKRGEDVYLVEVREGEIVHLPGRYGHTMFNVGESELITFNFVSKSFKSDYDTMKAKRGPAVYVMANGDIIKNNNYDTKRVWRCRPMPLSLDELVLTYAEKPSVEDWFTCEPFS